MRTHSPAAKVTFAVLLLFAVAVATQGSALDRRRAAKTGARAEVGPSGADVTLKTISHLTHPALLIFFQREKGGPASAAPRQETVTQGCMRVRERMRQLENISLPITVAVALGIYLLLMIYAAKTVPPLGKWLLAPILAAIFVGYLTSNYAAGQLAGGCPEESGAFPLDRFLSTAAWGCILTFIIFLILSIGKWYHREKRMRVAVE